MGQSSIVILAMLLISHLTSANVLLIGKNTTLSFEDIQANFTPMIKKSDQCGVLYVAEPLDACSDLVTVEKGSTFSTPYVLIIRGGCSFDDKIRNAQKAGYKAAIVYDNEDYGLLVSMSGNPYGLHIYGTFVSKATGEVLKEYVGRTDIELRLIPSFETEVWSIMAVSVILLLATSAVLATCFFVRRHRVRRLRLPPSSRMSEGSIRRIPVAIFNGVFEEPTTSVQCAICTEDYSDGEKLRILPCHHKFHARCVDVWLRKRRSICPFCRRDARTISNATESTPLLSPDLTPTSSFSLSSSFTTPSQSSYDLSISIRQESPSTSTTMQPHTVPTYLSHSRSHTSFPSIPVSRSSVDLSNAISRSSYNSPHQGSLGRSLQSRYTHVLSPRRVVRSLSQREHSLQKNNLHKSLTHFASASSLPDC